LELGKGFNFTATVSYKGNEVDDRFLRLRLTPKGKWWIMRSVWSRALKGEYESGQVVRTEHGAWSIGCYSIGTRENPDPV